MKPYFNNEERVARLNYEAGLWKGTRWCANSAVRGVAVSCHNLPREILVHCGALPTHFPTIQSTPQEANSENIMETFLDSRTEFERLKPGALLLPGDVIGLWLARDDFGNRVRHKHTNHLGVVLPGGWFVHVLMHKQTDFDSHSVSPWLERRRAAWRPVEQ